jgi:hypothetical protein
MELFRFGVPEPSLAGLTAAISSFSAESAFYVLARETEQPVEEQAPLPTYKVDTPIWFRYLRTLPKGTVTIGVSVWIVALPQAVSGAAGALRGERRSGRPDF